MAARIAEGARCGKVLIHEDFKYHKNRATEQVIHWRCWRKDCRAGIQTNVFDVHDENPHIAVLGQPIHNHESDGQIIAKDNIRNNIKGAVREDVTVPVKRVYDSVLRRYSQGGGDRETFPEFHTFRSTMARTRHRLLPNIPRTVGEVDIQGSWRQSWAGERYLLHQDNQWEILVFATDENLECLGRCREVYMDGTFRTTPSPYTQMFKIHGKYHNRVLAFAVSLMGGKTIGQYRQVLQALKRNMRRVNHRRWRPARVVCDFEQALMASIETELPTAQISGCFFHFTQSLWRQVQHLGLANVYQRHRNVKKCIRKVMSLGYLPLPLVRQNFYLLRAANRTRRLINRHPGLGDFLDYFDRNYLNGNFPPQMWNVYERDMDTRTNNFVESYHRAWNLAVGVRHPSLWIFIRRMKDKQAELEFSVDAGRRGDTPPARRRKWRDLESRLQRLKTQYRNGNRNLNEYWDAVCHCIGEFR